MADALAKELNLDAATVRAALAKVRPATRGAGRHGRGDGIAAALAAELKVDVAKLRAALQKVRPARGDRREALAAALATELNVDAAKVQAALDKLRPAPERRGERLSSLAQTLGVTPEQLRAAIDEVETDQRAAFAKALAQRLNLDAAKVQGVLDDLPRGGRRHG
jgi:gamma-glutamyl phosphate reductase